MNRGSEATSMSDKSENELSDIMNIPRMGPAHTTDPTTLHARNISECLPT